MLNRALGHEFQAHNSRPNPMLISSLNIHFMILAYSAEKQTPSPEVQT